MRNVVERVIGVLKKRFAYLRHAPYHDVKTHTKIILACCGLHNFLKDIDPDDVWEPDLVNGPEDEAEPAEVAPAEGGEIVIASSPAWNAWRENLKHEMWFNHSNGLKIDEHDEELDD